MNRGILFERKTEVRHRVGEYGRLLIDCAECLFDRQKRVTRVGEQFQHRPFAQCGLGQLRRNDRAHSVFKMFVAAANASLVTCASTVIDFIVARRQ